MGDTSAQHRQGWKLKPRRRRTFTDPLSDPATAPSIRLLKPNFIGLESCLREMTAYDLLAYIFLFLGGLHDLPVRGAQNQPNDCIPSFLRHF